MLCPALMFSYHSEKYSQIELKYFDGLYGPFGGFKVLTNSFSKSRTMLILPSLEVKCGCQLPGPQLNYIQNSGSVPYNVLQYQ